MQVSPWVTQLLAFVLDSEEHSHQHRRLVLPPHLHNRVPDWQQDVYLLAPHLEYVLGSH